MKRFFTFFLAAAVLISVLVLPAYAADEYEGKTVILYTGNIEGDVSIYEAVKSAKDSYESAGAEVLLVDTGNYLRGTAEANSDMGLGIYNIMDAVGYDIAAMGIYEFSYTDATTGYIYHGNYTKYYTQAELQNGAEALSYNQNKDGSVTGERAAKEPAGFTALSSNARDLAGVYSFEESVTVSTGAGTIVFYGITDPAAEDSVQDGYLSVYESTDGADNSGSRADHIVILSNDPDVSGGVYNDNIIISVATGEGMEAGAYIIDNITGEITKEDVDLTGEDSDIAAMVRELEENAAVVVGISEVILDGSDSANWNGETNLGDLVTDALVWYAENYIDGLDESVPVIAIQNGGNCDSFIYTGEITETDLLKALPFSPMGIGVIYLTGQELLETLEAASQQEDCPGFAQVSGLTYSIDTQKIYDGGAAYGSYYIADSVNRVTITEIYGEDFDPDATYAVVCDNYLINGNDTYYTFSEAKSAGAVYINNGTGIKVRDAVALYISEALGGVIGEEYAEAQGRITVNNFEDISYGDYYYDAVIWAVKNDITTGTGDNTFSPADSLTRAQLVTFLYRLAGEPSVEGMTAPFSDVSRDEYPDYYNAVIWAYNSGITQGKNSSDTFCPEDTVTRAEAVTFLYRFYGSQETSGDTSEFYDIEESDYYAAAVTWAVNTGITTGTAVNTFSPDGSCSRGQFVTFIYRAED